MASQAENRSKELTLMVGDVAPSFVQAQAEKIGDLARKFHICTPDQVRFD